MQRFFATALLSAACHAISLRASTATTINDSKHTTLPEVVEMQTTDILTARRTYGGGRFAMVEPSTHRENFFAEVGEYTLTCSDTFDRFREMPDVAAVMAANTPWEDASFTHDEAMYKKYDSHTWTRMADAFPASQGYSLF